ncbi:MAG: hypothetical protein KAR08_11130, partial [Candidatus Heimdallarchaeota archaeon]|nr:hypothetical protein [Candidatus Heimdallarchaeota archaeon]
EVFANSDGAIDETNYLGGSEENNVMPLYIPVKSHPRFRFTQDMWDVLEPSFTAPNYIGAESYNWYSSFTSEDFNPGWSISDVDPRAKKGYENALNCYINDFNSPTPCAYAMNHLDGWLVQIDNWEDGGVQALHEFVHVAGIYDLMFSSFTEEQAKTYSKQMALSCQAIFGKSNVRPDMDLDIPSPDNGKGFGMGLAGPCYVALGDYIDNPTMIWHDPQSYDGKNTVYWWNNRVKNHLEGFKNDSNGFYPEGMLYYGYSKYHLVDVLQFLKISGFGGLSNNYQNDMCAQAKDVIYSMLDYNYRGSDIRGDEGNLWRQISFGDTNSYERPGNDGLNNWDVLSAFGNLCDDVEVKESARKLRELAHDSGDPVWSPGALYYYTPLFTDVSEIDQISLPAFNFAESFDRVTLRRGFTYQDDTVIIFDGGDEATSGHPNAEFDFFVYVFGEPFLDYPQVPFEDDVRSEVWHNTISFTQSQALGYDTQYDSAALHQYYGGSNIQGSYPDFRFTPEEYTGDVLTPVGSDSGDYASFHAYRNYETATEPVTRNVVIFDDLLIHEDIVKRSEAGPIYHNWINIYDEFPSTTNNNILTLTRASTNKHYEINPVWSSAGTITLAGGDSGKAYCFQKTSCSGGKGNYGKYYHEVQGPEATTIFAHHWYLDSNKAATSLYNGTDIGVQAVYADHTTYVIFDTNEDNQISELGYTTNGVSLAVKDSTVAVTKATSLTNIFSSTN